MNSLDPRPIKSRFLVSVVGNVLRSGVSFASGLLVARGLGPAGYGELTFLLGSFLAIQSLLNMGSSSAFFTFISQRSRGRRFYLVYFSWLALQLAVTFAIIALIIPDKYFERIWLGHSRMIVVLACLAAFLQQQIWTMIGQIGESRRRTLHIQLLNFSVAVAYLLLVCWTLLAGDISVTRMLHILIWQYAVAAIVAYWILRADQSKPTEPEVTLSQIIMEYWTYCSPLILLWLVVFIYSFASNWMLQRFGGAAEQGYFQIASQFASISLLATTSILNIFWKEIAEAAARADHVKVASLYRRVNRGLVMLNATIAGFLLPWSKQIVEILLGPAYVDAWPILAVMFLYPIHQSMGQIGGTMFMARGDTKRYTVLSVANLLLVSAPITYFTLAPSTGAYIPGFGLGGIGMACSMVFANFLGVVVQAWFLARGGEWKFDWLYQGVGIPAIIGLGYFAKTLAGAFWDIENLGLIYLVGPVIIAGIIYIVCVASLIWLLPWLIAMDRDQILVLLRTRFAQD